MNRIRARAVVQIDSRQTKPRMKSEVRRKRLSQNDPDPHKDRNK